MLKTLLIIIITGLSFQGMAQSSIQRILQEVEKNNPKLKAHQQYLEAQKLGIRSQNNLTNPEIEWEKSFSSQEGKPYEVLVSQSFDFPTSYIYKNQLRDEKTANLQNIQAKVRQDILLETELICFELIYRNNQNIELSTRLDNAEKLTRFFEKRLQEGDANILEVNKIRMLALNTKNQLQLVRNKISNLKKDLQKQNGGLELNLNDLEYPVMSMDEDTKLLLANAVTTDPYLNQLRANEQIASKETSLVKTNSLPKISIGYRYLGSDLMKEANGMKLGISIPLWENKNKVKQAKLMELFRKEELSFQKMEKENEYEKLFQTFFSLKSSLSDYQNVFAEKKYDFLLRKALNFGEISGIEYLMESIYYYESFDTYLEIEYEYNINKAKILKYLL
ncbi:TolC family protein [Labilibaculum sp. K2S]|uniref:TolC family protein n=1 Tax=Labilibaculum sp. K2S TaxID=3056386 RepID=UPI0025A388C1|nr:TolC family protein [Labilibaculum sp. K2S]MDM8159753.1 TolC family protein [Labilibaculum sp. K2S]